VLPNTGLLKVNQQEQNVIQIIEDYDLKGVSMNRIATILNEQSIATKQGCEWSHKSVSRVLKRI